MSWSSGHAIGTNPITFPSAQRGMNVRTVARTGCPATATGAT